MKRGIRGLDFQKRIVVTFIFIFSVFSLLYLSTQPCYQCLTGMISQEFSYSLKVNFEPKFSENITDKVFYIGDRFYLDVNCTDADGHNITYLDDTSLFDINESTGVINTTLGSYGRWQVQIGCYDGLGYTNQTFVIFLPEPSGGGGRDDDRYNLIDRDDVDDGIDDLIGKINDTLKKLDDSYSECDLIDISKQIIDVRNKLNSYVQRLNVLKKNEDIVFRMRQRVLIESEYENLISSVIYKVLKIDSYQENNPNVVVIDTSDGLSDIHLDILNKMDFSEYQREQLYEDFIESDVNISLLVMNLDIYYLNDNNGVRTVVSKNISNIGRNLKNSYLIVNYPKDVAIHFSNIDLYPKDYIVVQEDPIIRWDVLNFSNGESKRFDSILSARLSEKQVNSIKYIIVYGKEPLSIIEEREPEIIEPTVQNDCMITYIMIGFVFLLLFIVLKFVSYEKHHKRVIDGFLFFMFVLNVLLGISATIFHNMCNMIMIAGIVELVLLMIVFFFVESLAKKRRKEINDLKSQISKIKSEIRDVIEDSDYK